MSTASHSEASVATQVLGLLGGAASQGGSEALAASLRACTRDRLLEFARQLGLKGTAKLAKDALVERVGEALAAHVVSPAADVPAAPSSETASRETASRETASRETASRETASRGARPGPGPSAKFELGPASAAEKTPAHIPWGYGVDRVTAMVIDPRRLYVYWEVTDAAIAAARKTLGAGGSGAWLNLRVYDITGRLFDGTNAHSYFDEGVSRNDRQWFFEIGKPTSTACIELGLKSAEGFFAKIVRSGRADFPRESPAADAAVEWLSVRTATGPAGEAVAGGAPIPDGFAHHLGAGGGALGGQGADDWQGWSDEAGWPAPGGVVHQTEGGWEWREEGPSFTTEAGSLEWTGPVHRSEWQAGPFTFPVDVPTMLEQHESGEISVRIEGGVAHVVYGPWQVVIRGLAARAERRVLATWEIRRTVEVAGGVASEGEGGVNGWWEPLAPGASEWRFVPGGGSERRWAGASELLARGGSEVYMVGASERLLKGASERLFTGASERRLRGASERLLKGASERLLGGASERTYAGGLGGASERVAAREGLGASENVARPDAGGAYPKGER